MGVCTSACNEDLKSYGQDELDRLRIRLKRSGRKPTGQFKKSRRRRSIDDKSNVIFSIKKNSDSPKGVVDYSHDGESEDTLSSMAEQLNLEVKHINGCRIYLHNDSRLLLDAKSLEMISIGKFRLFNVFKEISTIKTVIITSCNFKNHSKTLCKIIKDIMVSHLQIQIVGCDLPKKLRKQDLNLLKINAKEHKLDSLIIRDCEIGRKQHQCLKELMVATGSCEDNGFSIFDGWGRCATL
ncbi:unnamed protein product [Moneuplotes crassus]|uniref:Uncharacterized protein n=1 Tax=Euplotes crassus TaxID=5936 RepID=A0AAD1XUR5_EUPCR|nr:unnamed protein product [Moneuplotes crassus]